jgi:hypothetical protein
MRVDVWLDLVGKSVLNDKCIDKSDSHQPVH